MTTSTCSSRQGTTPASFLNGAHVLQPAQGWYADPARPADARWWDGQAWGAQSHTDTAAARAFQHHETLNEHVHDAIDRLWLAKLDQLLGVQEARPANRPPVAVPPPRPARSVVPAALSTFASDLALRITTERNGGSTWQGIADRLNLDAVPTARGGSQWRIRTVQNAAGFGRPTARPKPAVRNERRRDVLAVA